MYNLSLIESATRRIRMYESQPERRNISRSVNLGKSKLHPLCSGELHSFLK
jgi:hypothetical protein